jgi:hypothetical protein
MSALDEIVNRLDKVRRCGRGFVARCPAHEDRGPSLSFRETKDGRVLLHCFAGCSVSKVLTAVGLKLSDLFNRPPSSNGATPDLGRARAAVESDFFAAAYVLEHEARVVLDMAYCVARGPVSYSDLSRMALAIERVDAAREFFKRASAQFDDGALDRAPRRFDRIRKQPRRF